MRKDIDEEEFRPTRMAMPGIEEPEIPDDELLGASTLAKISPRSLPVDVVEEDIYEDNEDEEGEEDDAEWEEDEEPEANEEELS